MKNSETLFSGQAHGHSKNAGCLIEILITVIDRQFLSARTLPSGNREWPLVLIRTLRYSGRGRGGRQPEVKCSILGTN